jgi:hypothetical protein
MQSCCENFTFYDCLENNLKRQIKKSKICQTFQNLYNLQSVILIELEAEPSSHENSI